MKKGIVSILLSLSFCSTLVLLGCAEDDQIGDDSGFDRSVLLESLAENLIIPNLISLQSSVNVLVNAVNTFNADPTDESLSQMQQAWIQAVKEFQHTSAFGFGPGNIALGSFATVIGVFPVDESQVEQNIMNEDFNLRASFDRDVRGFYAIEYLIYGDPNADIDLVATFDQDRRDYLLLLATEIKTTVDDILGEWNTSYKEQFVNDDGTSAGSSISLFYNEFIKDYENLKNFKVELPAGLTAGQMSADPQSVEAYYSGVSSELLREHFESSKNIYFGRTRDGEELSGFDDYLQMVVGGPALVEQTVDQLSLIDALIAALPEGRLSDYVDSPEITALRDGLQANTANFKSSMSSLLGISITFNSGDGD